MWQVQARRIVPATGMAGAGLEVKDDKIGGRCMPVMSTLIAVVAGVRG